MFHVCAYCSRFSPSCRSDTFILCTGTYSLVGRVLVLVLDNKYLYLKCTGNIHTYCYEYHAHNNNKTISCEAPYIIGEANKNMVMILITKKILKCT